MSIKAQNVQPLMHNLLHMVRKTPMFARVYYASVTRAWQVNLTAVRTSGLSPQPC